MALQKMVPFPPAPLPASLVLRNHVILAVYRLKFQDLVATSVPVNFSRLVKESPTRCVQFLEPTLGYHSCRPETNWTGGSTLHSNHTRQAPSCYRLDTHLRNAQYV